MDQFVNAYTRSVTNSHFRCPCCFFATLPARGWNEICPVCFWEDDGQDDHDADEVRGGPNYELSLTAARKNFAAFGACDLRSMKHVRAPAKMELAGRRETLEQSVKVA